MAETHPFNYYAPTNANKLIIGSFPCFNGTDYGQWFYCGSGKNEFWQLLSEIFKSPVETKEQKMKLCDINHIAITDIAYKVDRTQNSCKDSALKIIEFNTEGISTCLSPDIKRLLFTSKFVEKHFHNLYPHNRIPSSVLISPSPSANIHIASLHEYKEMVSKGLLKSTYEYRILKYRHALSD